MRIKSKKGFQPKFQPRHSKNSYKKKDIRYFFSYFKKPFIFLSVIFGLWAGFNMLSPHIELSQMMPIDPNITFSVPFKITNKSNFSTTFVSSKFGILDLRPLKKSIRFRDSVIKVRYTKPPILSPGHSHIFICNFDKSIKIEGNKRYIGDVRIIANFHYLVFLKYSVSQDFTMIVNRYGHCYWAPIIK